MKSNKIIVHIMTALITGMVTIGVTYITTQGFGPTFNNIAPPDPNVITVDSLDHPDYTGFEIIRNVRVLDLRSRIQISQEEKLKEKKSPVTWTRYVLVKKTSENAKIIKFEFATTGIGINARCLTHTSVTKTSDNPHFHGEVSLKSWIIEVDISQELVGADILIILEATYWNSFSGEDSEWASITAMRNESIGIVILFPEDKPMIDKSHDLYLYEHGSKKESFQGLSRVIQSENRQVFAWEIPKPQSNFAYEVDWKW